MHYPVLAALLAATALTAPAYAQNAPAPLQVTLGGIENGKTIPAKFAYCRPDGRGQTQPGENISPEIGWRGAPEGTKSFAIIMVDKDVPADLKLANQPKEIAKDAPRQNFYHWTVANIPPTLNKILEGRASNGIKPGGKPFGRMEFGQTGQNDYSKVIQGPQGGYDGPCPPWNDKRLHTYYFRVYALDVPSLKLSESFKGDALEKAMQGHILAQGEASGTYSNNLSVLGGE